jgi:mevalonate kinase
LLGNPSDVCGGRTIAFTFRDFAARVTVERARRIEAAGTLLAPLLADAVAPGFARRQQGASTLLAAALKTLADRIPRLRELPSDEGIRLHVASDVPRQVGLAGSSAIVVAGLRALSGWFGLALAPAVVAELAWRAETEELGIAAGPMDRVVQAHEGLLAMDFAEPWSHVVLDPACLPPMFIAWDPEPGRDSGAVHAPVRARWERGDPEVVAAVAELGRLAVEGVEALRQRDATRLGRLVERNFELRAQVWGLDPRDAELVAIGRRRGAAVKLAGSGGAVVGLARDAEHGAALAGAYRDAGCRFLRPRVG